MNVEDMTDLERTVDATIGELIGMPLSTWTVMDLLNCDCPLALMGCLIQEMGAAVRASDPDRFRPLEAMATKLEAAILTEALMMRGARNSCQVIH